MRSKTMYRAVVSWWLTSFAAMTFNAVVFIVLNGLFEAVTGVEHVEVEHGRCGLLKEFAYYLNCAARAFLFSLLPLQPHPRLGRRRRQRGSGFRGECSEHRGKVFLQRVVPRDFYMSQTHKWGGNAAS